MYQTRRRGNARKNLLIGGLFIFCIFLIAQWFAHEGELVIVERENRKLTLWKDSVEFVNQSNTIVIEDLRKEIRDLQYKLQNERAYQQSMRKTLRPIEDHSDLIDEIKSDTNTKIQSNEPLSIN